MDVSMLCLVDSSMSPVTGVFFKYDFIQNISFLRGTEFSSKVQQDTHSSVYFIFYQCYPFGWFSHKIGRQNKARKW